MRPVKYDVPMVSSSAWGAYARAGAAAVCAVWTFGALAQTPAVGVAYRCDDGNEVRIASCTGSICDVELGPPGRLQPYLRMSLAGAATFLAAQHCVAPGGEAVAAPERPAPAIDRPLVTPERQAAPSALRGIAIQVGLAALVAALILPLLARARRNAGAGGPAGPVAGSASHGATAQPAKSACNSCSGRGNVSCPQCRGRRGEWTGPAGSTQWQSCWSCGGSGESRCSVCNGTGTSPY